MIVEWCNLCQSAPMEGTLTVIIDGEDHPVRLNSCKACAEKSLDTSTPNLLQ